MNIISQNLFILYIPTNDYFLLIFLSQFDIKIELYYYDILKIIVTIMKL